jgi:hypothetical protein
MLQYNLRPRRLASPLLLILWINAGSASAGGAIVGPMPTDYAWGSEVGLIASGETDGVSCPVNCQVACIIDCSPMPCGFETQQLSLRLTVFAAREPEMALRALDGGEMRVAHASGWPQTVAELTVVQDDTCLEVWVEALRVDGYAVYSLEIENLG